ncbi:MAG: helix-turn-helix domain-containing protein [Hominilimicola sp.]
MEFSIEQTVDRIHELMKKEKIKNTQLASKAGVSVHTLGKVLRLETREPSVSLIINVANALGVSADYLITGEDVHEKNGGFKISDHEKSVILAYREQSESVQATIDKILDVERPVTEKQAKKIG